MAGLQRDLFPSVLRTKSQYTLLIYLENTRKNINISSQGRDSDLECRE
jgi:hypothetical protein